MYSIYTVGGLRLFTSVNDTMPPTPFPLLKRRGEVVSSNGMRSVKERNHHIKRHVLSMAGDIHVRNENIWNGIRTGECPSGKDCALIANIILILYKYYIACIVLCICCESLV